MAEPALACHALHCRAGGRDLFTDLSFQVHAGERLALMGPSGSGKTTLLTTLAGLLPPVGGQVLVGGVPLAENPGLRREIALVLQSYGLLTLLTAAENIEVVLRAAGRDPRQAIAEAAAALERLGLGRHAGHLIEELSGGQQQRVAIARAIALRPRVLLADEPTAEQDAANRALVLDALIAAADRGAALVIATHDPEVAERCDRVIELRAAVPRAQGSPAR
ncbi:ABC transporter ATP-binding protein [Thermopolyspora flexuosa]|uniref:Putative ABC transport system ATP-binding protein n=1 Tax=Thermopolyspora flexuosa TaxID=103836 RepID=A0A543IXZ4_9ACTN|nr:ATP-binding cassette domain-containing protein [Thermopolyspora flexuosa]TQM75443.1 putative ABC transport system ATP-binding protein [Thermopolyspora flexuosa]GGM59410.1 ABC transporter ATP-binding protein [Thermopolyspora flexuosa]